MHLSQSIDIRTASVNAEIRRGEPSISHKVKAVLYFKDRFDPRDQERKLSARYGVGLNGRQGTLVLFHEDCEEQSWGLQLVDFSIERHATHVYAHPTKDKSALKKLINDLQCQAQAAKHLEDSACVNGDDSVILTILRFGFSQESLDAESNLLAKYGAGINGNGGLVVFPDRLTVQPGWQLVKLGINNGQRFALAKPCLDSEILQDALGYLQKQLERLEKKLEKEQEKKQTA